jgi:hypothetical protein
MVSSKKCRVFSIEHVFTFVGPRRLALQQAKSTAKHDQFAKETVNVNEFSMQGTDTGGLMPSI